MQLSWKRLLKQEYTPLTDWEGLGQHLERKCLGLTQVQGSPGPSWREDSPLMVCDSRGRDAGSAGVWERSLAPTAMRCERERERRWGVTMRWGGCLVRVLC